MVPVDPMAFAEAKFSVPSFISTPPKKLLFPVTVKTPVPVFTSLPLHPEVFI